MKLPVCRQILRKQCVNILFQLGVFFDIHRKSHFRKTLIFSTLSKQRYIIEYHFKILIIWRSQVQAMAGPHWKWRQWIVSCVSFVHILWLANLNAKIAKNERNAKKISIFFKLENWTTGHRTSDVFPKIFGTEREKEDGKVVEGR